MVLLDLPPTSFPQLCYDSLADISVKDPKLTLLVASGHKMPQKLPPCSKVYFNLLLLTHLLQMASEAGRVACL